jgi:hypothetical protein
MGDFTAIQFSTDRSSAPSDGQVLNREIIKDNATSNQPGVRISNVGAAYSMTLGPDGHAVISEGPATSSINMADLPSTETGILATARRGALPVASSDLRDEDTVDVGGTRTSVAVARRMGFIRTNSAGDNFNPTPEAQRELDGTAARERAAVAAQAAQAAATDETSLNRHPSDEVESLHHAFATKVPTGDAIAGLVQMHRDGKMNEATFNRIGEALGLDADATADAINAVSLGTSAQFAALARARGADPQEAMAWIRANRSEQSLHAIREHALGRNLRAWEPLVRDYLRSRG